MVSCVSHSSTPCLWVWALASIYLQLFPSLHPVQFSPASATDRSAVSELQRHTRRCQSPLWSTVQQGRHQLETHKNLIRPLMLTQSKLHFRLHRTQVILNLVKIHLVPNCDQCLFWKSGLSVFSDSAYHPDNLCFPLSLG